MPTIRQLFDRVRYLRGKVRQQDQLIRDAEAFEVAWGFQLEAAKGAVQRLEAGLGAVRASLPQMRTIRTNVLADLRAQEATLVQMAEAKRRAEQVAARIPIRDPYAGNAGHRGY